MANNLRYVDFALDELRYFTQAYNAGMRYNAMVAQAQRICECYLKQVISNNLLNNNDVMLQHNLRTIFTYIIDDLHLPLKHLHAPVMVLNNFYTHTRYPGREAFMASPQDVEAAFTAIGEIVRGVKEYI